MLDFMDQGGFGFIRRKGIINNDGSIFSYIAIGAAGSFVFPRFGIFHPHCFLCQFRVGFVKGWVIIDFSQGMRLPVF